VFAVTTNLAAAGAFGISADACFPMWDWVGGRYSVWSAIGLVIALGYGWSAFTGLLAGANALDEHAREVDPLKNVPMLMALLELWNTRYLGVETHVVLPYSQRLEHLSDFLQQLTMESNGKRVTLTGEEITEATAPVLWGSAGTIGQHSYYQLLHQGNRRFTADIVLPLTNGDVNLDAHRKLAANALAQSRAFLIGRTMEESTELAREKGLPPELAPHFQMPGNHPHNTLVMTAVSAETVGAMIATYEHKTYFLSALMGLNAFDQWGVELGKAIGKQIRTTLENATGMDDLDASTAALATAWLDANR
jgi:glucose-6-phosphate isomerase